MLITLVQADEDLRGLESWGRRRCPRGEGGTNRTNKTEKSVGEGGVELDLRQ